MTGGYWSFIGFDPVKKTGAVVLSNTRFDNDAIGLHAIDNRWPVEKLNAPRAARRTRSRSGNPGALRRRLSLRPRLYGPGVAGVWSSVGAGHAEIKVLELLAETDTEFFFKTMDVQVSFVTDSSGKAIKMITHVNGEDSVGIKVQ